MRASNKGPARLWAAALLALLPGLLTAMTLALVLSLAAHTSAFAAGPIVVTTAEDEQKADVDCSLGEAIRAANENEAVDGCAAESGTGQDAIRFRLGHHRVGFRAARHHG